MANPTPRNGFVQSTLDTPGVTVGIPHRRLPVMIFATRLRKDLPVSGRANGGRVRHRGAVARVLAGTPMMVPCMVLSRSRHTR